MERDLEVLRQIRERINETNALLNETDARIESLRDDLGRRIVESGLRTVTSITDLTRSVRELISTLKEDQNFT